VVAAAVLVTVAAEAAIDATLVLPTTAPPSTTTSVVRTAVAAIGEGVGGRLPATVAAVAHQTAGVRIVVVAAALSLAAVDDTITTTTAIAAERGGVSTPPSRETVARAETSFRPSITATATCGRRAVPLVPPGRAAFTTLHPHLLFRNSSDVFCAVGF